MLLMGVANARPPLRVPNRISDFYVRCRCACQDEKILKEMSVDGMLKKLYAYDSPSQLQEYEMNIGYQSKTSWLLWCSC